MRPTFSRATTFVISLLLCSCHRSSDAPTGPEWRSSIQYVGATWGPDGDTIYFLKQMSLDHKATGRLGLQAAGSEMHSNSIWFCKMNWDGSDKQEIAELWAGSNPYIDTQNGPVWMEVNAASSNMAFSVEFGMATAGMWVMGLDSRNLRRAFEPEWNDKEHEIDLHPSWSPDGSKLVYCKDSRELGIFEFTTGKRIRLTSGIRDLHPVWSPKGDWIAFTHYTDYSSSHGDRYIWLVRPDGSEQEPVTDDRSQKVRGWWPSWNSDGEQISLFNGILIIASPTNSKVSWIDTAPAIGGRSPWLLMGHHWGKRGWLICPGRTITFLESDGQKARLLAAGGSYDTPNSWGIDPTDLKGK